MHWAFLCKGLLFPTLCLTACGIGIVSYLHTNLRVAKNFERCERAFHQCQVWVTWQLFLRLLLPPVLRLYSLPPPCPPSSATLLASSFNASPCMPSCCTVLLYFSRHCTVRLQMFYLCLFFMYYLCEQFYKPITVQYSIASCVSWVRRLTLLYLWTNWTC